MLVTAYSLCINSSFQVIFTRCTSC